MSGAPNSQRRRASGSTPTTPTRFLFNAADARNAAMARCALGIGLSRQESSDNLGGGQHRLQIQAQLAKKKCGARQIGYCNRHRLPL